MKEYMTDLRILLGLKNEKTYDIGIDPGTNTGIAVWDRKSKCFKSIDTVKIHIAMEMVKYYRDVATLRRVLYEDARKRKWLGDKGRESLQGAGSIKRDSAIWDDFLKSLGIDAVSVPPSSNRTKLKSEEFKRLTKWMRRTNEHGRDAAMLVWGM